MAEPLKFNINEEVKVKLTARGREIWWAYTEANRPFDPTRAVLQMKEDVEGWSTWQLWELMRIFGPHMFNGCIIPFEDNVIQIPIPE